MTPRYRAALCCAALAALPVAAPSWGGELAEFTPVSIEQLQAPSVALGEKDVEIVLRKVALDAAVAAAPRPRRAQYLTTVLRDMGANPVPQVSQVMAVLSSSGKALDVYLEDSVAERAGKELHLGDRVRLYGYHVYNSPKHGPGVLVSGFETRSRFDELKERLSRWYDGLRSAPRRAH